MQLFSGRRDRDVEKYAFVTFTTLFLLVMIGAIKPLHMLSTENREVG